jgi:hypothetical protein
LSLNKSRRKGECGLSNDGTHINFPFFWYETIVDQGSGDDAVIYVAKIPLPKMINKMFFEKNAKLDSLPARSSTIQVRTSNGITIGIPIVFEAIFLSQIQITYDQWWDWVMKWQNE